MPFWCGYRVGCLLFASLVLFGLPFSKGPLRPLKNTRRSAAATATPPVRFTLPVRVTFRVRGIPPFDDPWERARNASNQNDDSCASPRSRTPDRSPPVSFPALGLVFSWPDLYLVPVKECIPLSDHIAANPGPILRPGCRPSTRAPAYILSAGCRRTGPCFVRLSSDMVF